MPPNLQINDKAIGAALISIVRDRGLGSMSKTELDALLLHLIEEHSNSAISNSELALFLRAPVARIKRLRHEAVLRFGGDDLNALFRRRLQALVRTANFEFSILKSASGKPNETRILMVIEDEFIRSQLLGHLKKVGSHADWSFNSELLKVEPKALLRVMIEILPGNEIVQLATSLNLTPGAKLKDQLIETIGEFVSKARELGLTQLADASLTIVKDSVTNSCMVALLLHIMGLS